MIKNSNRNTNCICYYMCPYSTSLFLQMSPASGLVSILKKRRVCVDNVSVSASSEPQPEKPTAKRRVRFKVPDDSYEQGVCLFISHKSDIKNVFCMWNYQIPVSLLLCRGWWWRLLPAPLLALFGYSSDQCGGNRPLLCSGRCPLLSLSGLLQKCRFLHWADTAWNNSDPTLVYPRVIAANSLST